jgi:HD superfamily phosphohydrolase YqeK
MIFHTLPCVQMAITNLFVWIYLSDKSYVFSLDAGVDFYQHLYAHSLKKNEAQNMSNKLQIT